MKQNHRNGPRVESASLSLAFVHAEPLPIRTTSREQRGKEEEQQKRAYYRVEQHLGPDAFHSNGAALG